MNRNDAIDLLRKAGTPEDQITDESILIASVIGTAIAEAFAKALAQKITSSINYGVERPEGAIDFQPVQCACGFIELRFNQLPVTTCPKCGKSLDILDAEYIEED